MITYPPGDITPHQFRRLAEGYEPQISYTAYDGSATFHLMGPLSPIPGVQDGLTITRESIKGFIAPWQTLDQAGANQDGVTFNDAVYQPAEIDMVVEAHGNSPQRLRKVVRDWVSSWDPHQQGELSVFTAENGLWWAPVRWLKAPGDPLGRSKSLRQRFVWTCRIDDAFWRSYDSTSSIGFAYEDTTDTFSNSYLTGLGPNWPLYYSGPGGGIIRSDGNQAVWVDDPFNTFNTQSREVVAGPLKNFNTKTTNQVVNMVLGSIPEISFPSGAFNDLWGRMGRNGDGSWNGTGVRARIGWGYVELAYFKNFTKTIMTSRPLIIPPVMGEKFTLMCGYEGDERMFKLMRNGVEILGHKEEGTGSSVGTAFRGIGFGMYAAGALITQATPANVRKISSGDSATVSQGGFMSLTNIGDVEAWPRFLLYGPGTFRIGNGPGSSDIVEFGPLYENQVVLLETEPRRRAVVDLSPAAVPAQPLNLFQQIIKALSSFASANNTPPLLQQFESVFGILPPQGNLYQYLNGRFTRPIPAKPPGEMPVTSNIRVAIDNGNASSRVVAALTPRRRWPL